MVDKEWEATEMDRVNDLDYKVLRITNIIHDAA